MLVIVGRVLSSRVNIVFTLVRTSEAGAARSEGCEGCSLPSLSPPYFFFKKQNFFTYSCLSYNYRQYFFLKKIIFLQKLATRKDSHSLS